MSLLSVAAETPPEHRVTLIDEQIEDVPLDRRWDLVGITVMTAVAPRAYELADAFRARGIPVVLGGMHPTFLPQEALLHADAVVAGDVEGLWTRILDDARQGRLAGVYRSAAPPSLAGLKSPPRHLLQRKEYSTIQAVQATRGCPHACAFCSVSAFHGAKQRRRPVDEVAREVAGLADRFVVMIDDNIIADAGYAAELFDALKPLGKRWVSQVTLKVADDDGLIRRMADSGCIGAFVGLETFAGGKLDGVEKGFNRVDEYRDRIRALHAQGISVKSGVVLGFDGDGVGVFRQTLEALDDLEIDLAQISILTPLPGTALHQAMGGRILDRNWAHYDYHHVTFEPKKMSVEALQAGHDWLTREFYSPLRIARRLNRVAARPRGMRAWPYVAAVSGAYYGRVVRWHIEGYDPAGEPRPARRRFPEGAGAVAGVQSPPSA